MTDLLRPLTAAISQVRVAMNEHEQKLSTNEMKTRYTLIDPILRALGWDVSDLHVVEVEYGTLEKKRVDYALLSSDRKPLILVEAKKLNKSHTSQDVSQLLSYCMEAGARYGVLTDGNDWEVYDTSRAKPLKEKRTMSIVLRSQKPAVATRYLMDLWKDYVREGGPAHTLTTGAT